MTLMLLGSGFSFSNLSSGLGREGTWFILFEGPIHVLMYKYIYIYLYKCQYFRCLLSPCIYIYIYVCIYIYIYHLCVCNTPFFAKKRNRVLGCYGQGGASRNLWSSLLLRPWRAIWRRQRWIWLRQTLFFSRRRPLLQQGFPQKLCYSVSCHGQIRIPLSICIYIYFYACVIYKWKIERTMSKLSFLVVNCRFIKTTCVWLYACVSVCNKLNSLYISGVASVAGMAA